MVSSLGSSKSTKVKKKNLALCDRFLLIEEIAKLRKSTKTQRAERILFVVKQKKIKNASSLELSQIAKCSKQFIGKKRTGQKYVKKQVKQNRKLLIEQENKIVEWIRNRYSQKKIQTTPKQIREEIFRRWKITVSGNFHKYLVRRHIDKLVIKIATARQVQRMLVRAEDIQKHLTNLKISVKGKRACVVINGDEIGIQAYCDTRDQCFIIPAEYKDDEIHIAVDRSEPRVSAMIAVTLDSQLLPPFLISKESAIQQQLLQNNVIQNENAIVVNSTSSMMNIDLMLQWVRDVFIKFVKLQRQKYRLQNRYEAVLIVDNMTAHCNKDVKDLLKANSIILLTLPPHSTHFTQLSDVGIFGALKLYYQQNKEGIAQFTLAQIAAHIIDASQKAASLMTIKNSFATCAVLSVVKGEHLETDVNMHAFDEDIQQLQADNTSTAITLTPTGRKRKTAKFKILNS